MNCAAVATAGVALAARPARIDRVCDWIGPPRELPGFEHVGFTQSGLWVFQLLPEAMPEAAPPLGVTWREQLRIEVAA